MRNTAYRFDPKLTEMAKNLFGDELIKAAFVAALHFPLSSQEETEDRLDKAMYKEVTTDIDGLGKHIMIEFCNGKKVDFSSSEWFTISGDEVDEEDADCSDLGEEDEEEQIAQKEKPFEYRGTVTVPIKDGREIEVAYSYIGATEDLPEQCDWWFPGNPVLDFDGNDVHTFVTDAMKEYLLQDL